MDEKAEFFERVIRNPHRPTSDPSSHDISGGNGKLSGGGRALRAGAS
jgi:hypothetical protein